MAVCRLQACVIYFVVTILTIADCCRAGPARDVGEASHRLIGSGDRAREIIHTA